MAVTHSLDDIAVGRSKVLKRLVDNCKGIGDKEREDPAFQEIVEASHDINANVKDKIIKIKKSILRIKRLKGTKK